MLGPVSAGIGDHLLGANRPCNYNQAIQGNSAFFPQRDRKWVRAKVHWCYVGKCTEECRMHQAPEMPTLNNDKTEDQAPKNGRKREGGKRHKVDRAYHTESVFVALRWLSHKVKRLAILRFILLYPFFILILTTIVLCLTKLSAIFLCLQTI